ncbi:MAG: hypothetical protein HYZ45_05420 [Burkholderiales bacterium]|nr:hypothetical protein [Burkholderiales bacterium]
MDWQTLAILAQVEIEWRQLPEDVGCVGTWVRLYASLSEDGASCSQHPPRRVWFIDRHGIHAKDVSSYARFHAVLIEQKWLSPMIYSRPNEKIFGRRHEIGLAAIAPLNGGPDWYLEFQWGHLCGASYRYCAMPSIEKVVRLNRLWIS